MNGVSCERASISIVIFPVSNTCSDGHLVLDFGFERKKNHRTQLPRIRLRHKSSVFSAVYLLICKNTASWLESLKFSLFSFFFDSNTLLHRNCYAVSKNRKLEKNSKLVLTFCWILLFPFELIFSCSFTFILIPSSSVRIRKNMIFQ